MEILLIKLEKYCSVTVWLAGSRRGHSSCTVNKNRSMACQKSSGHHFSRSIRPWYTQPKPLPKFITCSWVQSNSVCTSSVFTRYSSYRL